MMIAAYVSSAATALALLCHVIAAAEEDVVVLNSDNDQNTICDVNPYVYRFDCHPEYYSSPSRCNNRGCCWRDTLSSSSSSINDDSINTIVNNDGKSSSKIGRPYCYFPVNYPSYKVTQWAETNYGYRAVLIKEASSPWPNDILNLTLYIWFQSQTVLHFKIVDSKNARYEVPIEMPKPPAVKPSTTDYSVEYFSSPFGLKVLRKSTGATLFNSIISTAPLIYADQFLQISTLLDSPWLYGLGENYGPLLIDATQYRKFTFWARDQIPIMHSNLYGAHPFYMNIEKSKEAHGVFFLNSNAMEVDVQPAPALTFRTIGGVLDFYIFTGPTLENVVQQYVQTIGIPAMPPFWGLGFHLCRWKYNNIDRLKTIIKRNKDIGIPYDVQWSDIDYMENEKLWTYDKVNYNGLPQLIDQLHKDTMKYIIILDPGISDKYPGRYPPYDRGVQQNVFIRNYTGHILQGQVWPGPTVYPDFTHPNATSWWLKDAEDFHKVLPYDGLWIDMNEPSNFVSGSSVGCTMNNLDRPPFVPAISGDGTLEFKTLCGSARQHVSTHYNLHNMYGLHEAMATHEVLLKIMKKRSLSVSRSTFPSHGKYGQHWTGDVRATWTDLYYSIPGLLNFQMFGIPFVGADVCGFSGNSNEELCIRWTQLGAFYPFMRNHNDGDSIDQDPGAWGTSAQKIMKEAIELRYSLLPFMYTQFYLNQLDGSPVIRPLSFAFQADVETYKIDKQFLWGSSLLISPILERGKFNLTAYFPSGGWYDVFNHFKLTSVGRYYYLNTPLNKINLHLREGNIIPWQQSAVTTAKSRKNAINLMAGLDTKQAATGQLFWDDGDSLDTIGKKLYTLIKFTASRGTLYGKVQLKGYRPVDELRLGSIAILGVDRKPTTLLLNNKTKEFQWRDDVNEIFITNANVTLLEEFTTVWI
ncbi:hypothetical protein HELRODRAFT_96716 [Helobdella robusta]|uniref:P-type domain-containing protein n=1 Tax=Helobdella robusta TaxID=6412 RepID=T1G9D4_HELRO|nr:hypothetical protein HELRODRAFT_96716 [Helobdella robusta]ESO11524.1 hypothetical protein HELRODRAFT_96716 [Helobdella robusta]